MELEQARKRAAELRAVIEKNNRLYYDQDAPELEDYEYDQLTRELKTIEAQFPQLVTPDSPTQHVGGTPSGKFSKVAHAVKMESLQDAFSLDELREFDQRVREAGVTPEYVVEIKIDGLSVSLEYRNGRLTRGSTRGDGLVGEDVTENLATIKSIPKEIPNAPDFLEVRGEVYMPHEAFFALKEQQELEDKTPFKNPRNAAAGSLRQKDAKITAARGLSIFVFNLQQVEGKTFTTHSETLDYIKSLGFPVLPVLADIGVETYTQNTFSPRRYEIWTMQSGYHNLPTICGFDEHDGAEYRAQDVTADLTGTNPSISMELATAYPVGEMQAKGTISGVLTYRRTVTLKKPENTVILEDHTNTGDVIMNFITYAKPTLQDPAMGTADDATSAALTGALTVGEATLLWTGAELLAIETLPITDARLKTAWDHDLYRIRLKMSGEDFRLTVK